MIEMGKKYKTRSGREVRIYATDGEEPKPVHGAALINGEWSLIKWTQDGAVFVGVLGEYDLDLVEVPEEIEFAGWVNIYERSGYFHVNREVADLRATTSRIACVPFTLKFKKGEGL